MSPRVTGAGYRPALRCFALFALLSVLLMGPWGMIERAYSRLFCATGNVLLSGAGGDEGLFGSRGAAHFFSETEVDTEHDVKIALLRLDRGLDSLGSRRASSRHLGYMPSAMLVALVLASPVSWRRRAWALLWGLVVVDLFVGLRLVFVLVDAFNGIAAHCLYRMTKPWSSLFDVAYRVIADVPATTYLVPIVVWVLVTFRRGDLGSVLPVAEVSPRAEPERE